MLTLHLDHGGNLVRTDRQTHRLDGRNVTTVFEYGPDGRLVRTQRDTSDLSFNPLTITTERGYTQGRLTRVATTSTQPQQSQWVAYDYGPKGLLRSVRRGWFDDNGPQEATDRVETDALGRLVVLEMANGGKRKSFGYDDSGRLTSYCPTEGSEYLFEYDTSERVRKVARRDDVARDTRPTFSMTWDERGLPKLSLSTETGEPQVCSFETTAEAVTSANCGGETEFTVVYTTP